MGWFKSLFGKGTIRVEFINDQGETWESTIPYTGSASSKTEGQLLASISNSLYVEDGHNVKQIRILGIHGTGVFQEISGEWYHP